MSGVCHAYTPSYSIRATRLYELHGVVTTSNGNQGEGGTRDRTHTRHYTRCNTDEGNTGVIKKREEDF